MSRSSTLPPVGLLDRRRTDETRLRAWLVYVVDTAIEMLDALDAPTAEREPDGDDEVVSEDDGLVVGWKHVGRSA